MLGILLTVCTLTGNWHYLLYAIAFVAIFVVVLLYGLYLEYNAQEELERRRKEEERQQQRWKQRI